MGGGGGESRVFGGSAGGAVLGKRTSCLRVRRFSEGGRSKGEGGVLGPR